VSMLTTCLWFDTEGEEAAKFYTSIFPNSRIGHISRMTVGFELDGQKFVALNGGPQYQFSEAISFQIPCDSQEEVDSYWDQLVEGGEEGPCGWLKDRFGVSWQVVPRRLIELLQDPETSEPVTSCMMQMKKIDIAALEEAAAGVRA
jgi:predicted 3-demethylubiquinone-9 3-methyltransferase (glyoxalase superfamily)